jgi:preprotein translocase subunit SecA
MVSEQAMAKNKKKGRKQVHPDDYFAAGPFEFARFGRFVVSRSRATAQELRFTQRKMAELLPQIISDIDDLVRRIAERVASLPPERLLHRAWWEFATFAMGLTGDSGADKDLAVRMIDYVQSVIASVSPNPSGAHDVSDEEWGALQEDVRALFSRLTIDYQICLTAHRRSSYPMIDPELEEFRSQAEMFWMNVRGKRYQPHEKQALTELLAPHSDVLIRLFGIDAKALVDELERILTKLTRGLHDALVELDDLVQRSPRSSELSTGSEVRPANSQTQGVVGDAELVARRDRIMGEILGVDLFDVEKMTRLPQSLVDELAWSPGQDREFFAPGDFAGWPLRVWPIMKRPFIRLDGHVLCFDLFGLFDNFYRVLQRTISRLAPEYKETWNTRQKAVSEELPFVYFGKLLPRALVYRSVFYPAITADGSTQWCEADGLVGYDDHLFVIEVKAGAFTYTSPATDLEAHFRSLRNLLLNPASQGTRFVDYLESASEVPISDQEHNQIGRLRRADFRNVTICAITLDAFTELAARAQHLRKIGIDVGNRAVWALSIDDLRVFADLFDNPLAFLHFAEQRMRATGSNLVELYDELDHLGLYFETNNYAQFAHEVTGGKFSRLTLDGYRTPIDRFYRGIVCGDPVALPQQKLPRRLSEVVGFLARSNAVGRSEIASFLLDGGAECREMIANAIDQQLRESMELRRVRPASTSGDFRLTLFSWSPVAPRRAALALEHTRTVMVANRENDRMLIELEYSDAGVLEHVYWKRLKAAEILSIDRARLRVAGSELRREHFEKGQLARGEEKIGRNEQCPCGSGRKYKRCCIMQ